MSYAEMRGVKLVLADLGKQFNRLNERLDNQDNLLKVKVYSFSHFINSSCLYSKWNSIVLFWFVWQTMNTKNYNAEMQMKKQMEKQKEKRIDERIERLERLLDSSQVNLFMICFRDFFLNWLKLFKLLKRYQEAWTDQISRMVRYWTWTIIR